MSAFGHSSGVSRNKPDLGCYCQKSVSEEREREREKGGGGGGVLVRVCFVCEYFG